MRRMARSKRPLSKDFRCGFLSIRLTETDGYGFRARRHLLQTIKARQIISRQWLQIKNNIIQLGFARPLSASNSTQLLSRVAISQS